MTDQERKDFKDKVLEVFASFNALAPEACLGKLKNDILRVIETAGKEHKFKNGDIVTHVDDGADIIRRNHMIINTTRLGYILENGRSIELADQDDWELVEGTTIPDIMDLHYWEALDGEPAGKSILPVFDEGYWKRLGEGPVSDATHDLSNLERTGKDLKESPAPHRPKVKEATGKLKELIDNMDEKELEKTRQLMEQEAMAAEKERITSEYMEQMQKEFGYKDYTFWNGLKDGFDLGAGWNDRRFTEKVTILSDKIESLEAARVALKEVHNEDMKQLRQLTIDKACAWIDKEAHRYIVTRPIHGVETAVLDVSITADFRKAMEDQQ